MNILITGGTGFIGSRLAEYLLKNKHKVIFLTRDQKKMLKWNQYDRIDSISVDMHRPIQKSLSKIPLPIHGIFHLAANLTYFGPREKLYRDNVLYTKELLEWGDTKQVNFFVYTSTVEVMGTADTKPLREEDPCCPGSDYGWSKYEAEKLVTTYGKKTALPTVSLRLGNIYGPGSRFMIPDIAQAITEGERHILTTYYHQIKDRLVHPGFVDDMAQAIAHSSSIKRSGEVYTLTGSEPVTIKTLFQKISQCMKFSFSAPEQYSEREIALQRRIRVQREKNEADIVSYLYQGNRFYSIEKAKKELGFSPKTDLKQGIEKTLRWTES